MYISKVLDAGGMDEIMSKETKHIEVIGKFSVTFLLQASLNELL